MTDIKNTKALNTKRKPITMERKLITQGGGGCTIYLPKKWVTGKSLKGGDKITITEKGSGLFIDSGNREQKNSKVILNDANRKDLRNLLTHLYRSGQDTIEFENATEEDIREIKTITQDLLLGFETTIQEKNTCTISNISEPSEQKYEALLRRTFLIIKETAENITNDMMAGTYVHPEEIKDATTQQDKLILFCRRILIKEKHVRNPLASWEMLTFLMHIQHAQFYLYEYARKNRFKSTKRVKELLEDIKNYFGLLYEAFYKKDMGFIHRINNAKKILHFGKCYEYMEKSSGKETVVLSHIREILRLIQIGSSPIVVELLDAPEE